MSPEAQLLAILRPLVERAQRAHARATAAGWAVRRTSTGAHYVEIPRYPQRKPAQLWLAEEGPDDELRLRVDRVELRRVGYGAGCVRQLSLLEAVRLEQHLPAGVHGRILAARRRMTAEQARRLLLAAGVHPRKVQRARKGAVKVAAQAIRRADLRLELLGTPVGVDHEGRAVYLMPDSEHGTATWAWLALPDLEPALAG